MDDLKGLLTKHNTERTDLTKRLLKEGVLQGSDWPRVDMAGGNPAVMKFMEPAILEDLRLNDGNAPRQYFWIAEEDGKQAVHEEAIEGGTYAHIHTLDSQACELADWAIAMSMMANKQLSSAIVVVEMWARAHNFFWVSFIVWFGTLLMWVLTAMWHAHADLTIFVGGGDFITKKGCNFAYMKLFAAMTFLKMICVPRQISESPVTFHIRKMAQPYAVGKLDGKRVWVTGYVSKAQYENENRRAFLLQAPMLVFKDVLLVGIQCWLGYVGDTTVALEWAIFTGILSTAWDIRKFYVAVNFWNQAQHDLTDKKTALQHRLAIGDKDIVQIEQELRVLNKELTKMPASRCWRWWTTRT